jgi:hypothetical protein
MATNRRVRIQWFAFVLLILWSGCGKKEQPAQVNITLSTQSVLRQVRPGFILGANLGCWVSDAKLGTRTQQLLRDLKPAVARFPGGNLSNNFCWETQRVSDNDHILWDDWSWGIDVNEYLALLKTISCVPMFSLNPFDHTIDGQAHNAVEEAADLARLFVANGFEGAFYEVGNENDGWWNPMLTISDYADAFVALIRAVREVDPSAKSMGPVASGYNLQWIAGFLDALQARGELGLLDYLSYHHYGGYIANNNQDRINLNDPQQFGQEIDSIRNLLADRGASGVKIAVTEMNAAIWGEACDRDKFTINQALWLADAIGTCFLKADMANVWIHLHPGSDPHSLIDDQPSPPVPTRNYWPVYLAAQTLSGTDPSIQVSVLETSSDISTASLTLYSVRKDDGHVGLLIVNKQAKEEEAVVRLSFFPSSAGGRSISRGEYELGAGPKSLMVKIEGNELRLTLPAFSITGLDIK